MDRAASSSSAPQITDWDREQAKGLAEGAHGHIEYADPGDPDEPIVEAIAEAREHGQLQGACELVMLLGWSTGHADDMAQLLKETRQNLEEMRKRAHDAGVAEARSK